MNQFYKIFAVVAFVVGFGIQANAQCAYDNTLYAIFNAPTVVGASVGLDDCVYGGEYNRINNMVAGHTYRISTCSQNTTFDTKLTIYPQGGGSPLGFNDDFCDLQSEIIFTPTVSGNYDILVDEWGPSGACLTNTDCAELIITLISTGGGPSLYCIPTYTFGTEDGDFIDGVSVGTINNQNSGSTGGPTFTYYENISTSLTQGIPYTLTVTNNPDFTEAIAAWIDLNQNGTFETNEKLGEVTGVAPGATATINFTIPFDASTGSTRIRVRMAWNSSNIDPCINYGWGETEDYPIEVLGGTPPPPTVPSCATSVSPSNGTIDASINTTLSWSAGTGSPTSYLVYFGTTPTPALVATVTGTTYDPGLLNPATVYYFQIVPANAEGEADGCQVFSFTTSGSTVPTFIMGDGTVNTCTGNFFDSGNATGNYQNNELFFYTIYPDQANSLVQLTFNSFSTEETFDELYIFDGDGPDALLIGDPISGTITPGTFTATTASGALTLVFISDGSFTSSGWSATISCLSALDLPGCANNLSPANQATGVIINPTITWQAASGSVTGYEVYFGTTPTPALVDPNNTTLSYTPSVLQPNTVYYYQIVPFNANGPADGCEVLSFTTGETININMQNGTFTTCNGNFFDSGGPSSAYQNFENLTLTLLPSDANSKIQVTFNSFATENNFDFLQIYDGNSTAAPQIGPVAGYSGTNSPGIVTSTATDGSLTFVFTSDVSGTPAGWSAVINCVSSLDLPGCATITSGPANGASDICLNAVTFNWTPPTSVVDGYEVYFGTPTAVLVGTQTTTSFSPVGLLQPNTAYEFYVLPFNANGVASGCDVVSFLTGNCVTYCEASSNPANCGGTSEFIANVQVGSINNPSGCTGYTDFTSVSTNLTAGTSNPITVTNGSSSWSSDQCGIWVDWNSDGDFDDAGETIAPIAGSPGVGPYTASIDVPADATGPKRMRVRINFGVATACGLSSFGEVEDYTLNIVPAQSGAPECVVYLTPTNGAIEVSTNNVTLTWEAAATGGTPSSYDVYFGTTPNPPLVASGITQTSFNAGNLSTATTYYWQVEAINNDGVAVDCDIVSFTTSETAVLIMQNGEATTCNGLFYDSGGQSGNYQNSENLVYTIFPSTPGGFVKVEFTAFNTENNFDRLRVFNGVGIGGTLLGNFTGTALPPSVTSNSPDGALTFQFTSDVSVTSTGWEAIVTCEFADVAPGCATNLLPADAAENINVTAQLSWQAGSGISTGYNVYFGTSPTPDLVATGITTTTYNPGVLAVNTTYYWYVIPTNSVGEATGCQVQSFTTTSEVNVLMTNGQFTLCEGNFYDSGGPAGNYSNNENFTLTLFPSSPNSAIQVQFSAFQIENNFERLRIYNGNSTAAPQIGPALGYTGAGSPGTVISSASDGSLTFVFTSDGSVNQAGWTALISCVSTLELPVCAILQAPADFASNIPSTGTTLSWLNGGGIVTGYDVYFGTDPFNLPLVSANQVGTTYATGQLALNTTYYWQITPINNNGPAVDCPVFSFTTEAVLSLNMQNGTFTTCDANFFDNGGPGANYSNSQNLTLTLLPSTPGAFVQVVFNSFALENNFDFLRIYNGNSTAAPQIGPAAGFTGANNPGTVLSSSVDGSLTFVFTSDGSVSAAGWAALVSCVTVNEVPGCATNLVPAAGAVNVSASSQLTWSAPTEGVATGYDVYFGTSPNPPLVAANVVGTSYNPGALTLNTTYYWYVVPVNEFGPAVGCVEQSFTTTDQLNINMQNGTFTTCNANFFDAGGPTANYTNNENFTITFFPSTPGQNVQVTFSAFALENNFDFLRIYNGSSTAEPQIGPVAGYTGANNPGTVLSSAPDGSLTFVFTSDGSVTAAGWSALVTCFNPNAVPNCPIITSGPANGATGICLNQASFSWTNGGGIVDAYEVYFGTPTASLVASQTTTTFNPGVLLPNTTYEFYIVPVNGSGPALGCDVITFTTGECVIYCDATSNPANCVGNNEFIANVQVGDINNPSGCSGYTDFTSISTSVAIGLSYPITVTNGSSAWTGDQCGIWVDWNQDGDFTDAGEAITPVAGSPGVGPYTANINVPVGALTGPTRMRVRINFGVANPCGSTAFGEVEDYTLIVLAPTSGAPSCAINLVPANNAVNISNTAVLTWSPDINNGGTPTGYDVYFGTDPNPPLVSANQSASTFNPGALTPNTTYYWYVLPINNEGVAVDCQIFSFTTTETINVNMQNGTIVTCNANFFDSGGPNGNYTNNQNFTLTFTPSVPGNFIQVTFNSFNTEAGFDFLRIYNGNSIAAPQIGPAAGYNGAGSPGVVTSTAPDGSLTFVFTSDVSVTAAGWNATVICLDPNVAPGCPVITAGPANGATEVCTDDVIFTWQNAAGSVVDNYYVFFGPQGAVDFVDFTSTNLFAPGALQQNTTYQLVLVPENAAGQNLACDTITFTTGTCTQIGCVSCPSGAIQEGEACGGDINGGCNSTPSAFGTIACGQTICGSTFYNGTTRDTDWYNFTVTEAGTYTVTVNAEFAGTVFYANAANCSNVQVINSVDFASCQATTLTSFLTPGVYTVIVVPSFTGPIIDCVSGLNNYTVSVGSATGQASIAPVAPVCVTTAPFNLFAVPAGGTWSGPGIIDPVNGTFDASVAGIGSVVVSYTTAGGCQSTDQVTIVVGAGGVAPSLPTGSASVCSGQATSAVSVEPFTGASSYVWVLTPTDAGTISGTTENATITWNPSFEGLASVVVATQSACGLSPFSASLDIVVGNTPAAPAAIDGPSTVCVVSTTYSTTGSNGATSYTWTLTPAEAGTISGTGPSAIVTWSTAYTGPAIVSVTATNACGTSTATTLNATKLPNPFADFVGLAASYCQSDAPVELTGIPSGGTFSITTSAGAASGGIFGNVFNPGDAGVGNFTITYTVQIGQCIGSRVQDVIVLSAPTVSIEALPATICSQSSGITLVGTPANGTFSGTGVVDGVFNPSLAGAGVHTITYTVPGTGGGCDGVATVSVTVNPSPNVAISPITSPLCVNSSAVLISGTPAPGQAFINGNPVTVFDPATLGVGTYVVRYEVDNGVCIGFAEQTVTVTNAISGTINGLPATICSNATPIVLSSSPSGGIFSGPGIQGNIFDPKLAGPGVHTITCVINQGACSAVITQTVTVNPSPMAYFTYSTSGFNLVLNNASQNASSFEWSFGDGNTSTLENPTHSYGSNGSYIITLTANSPNCGSSSFSLPLEMSVGIGEIADVEDVRLFPNPTAGLVNLQFFSQRNQSFSVRITDAAGRLIEQDAITNYSGQFNKTYDLAELARGMYFFTITSNNGSINYKVIKQ